MYKKSLGTHELRALVVLLISFGCHWNESIIILRYLEIRSVRVIGFPEER